MTSFISETQRTSITIRDGALCVLCGIEPVDLPHIVTRKSRDPGQVDWIRSMTPSLLNFRKDDMMNLICLCPTHRRQFDNGYFVFVPSEGQRRQLLDRQNTYLSLREATLSHGEQIPVELFSISSMSLIYPYLFWTGLYLSTQSDALRSLHVCLRQRQFSCLSSASFPSIPCRPYGRGAATPSKRYPFPERLE